MLKLWHDVGKIRQNNAKVCLNYSETILKCGEKLDNFLATKALRHKEKLGADFQVYGPVFVSLRQGLRSRFEIFKLWLLSLRVKWDGEDLG